MMPQVIARFNNQEITDVPKDLYINPQALQIFLDLFEGPLDLLLYLIKRQNLDILTIPIATITQQYINYINAMQILNLDLAAEYLLMASMLLEIKSRMLLPKPKAIENEVEVDPRQELINRLIEYEKIKVAATQLAKHPTANYDYLWLNLETNQVNNLLPQVLIQDLAKIWHEVLIKSMAYPKEHYIKRQELSLRQHMALIVRKLNQIKRASFFSLLNSHLGVSYLVVNFIAILELTKEGLLQINKTNNSEIIISLSKEINYE